MTADPVVGPETGSRGKLARRLATALVNVLTAGRLVLAGVFPFVPAAWRLPTVVVGGLSDLVDGWISRRAGVESTFGRIVDPIADKAFVGSVLLTLWYAGELALWQIPLVGFRDLAVLLGSFSQVVLHGWGCVREMPPSILGKLATAAQFVFLAAVMYHHSLAPYTFLLAATLSLAAGVDYVIRPRPTDT
ncbi:MAG: CDP-alcohol phosphatidyltransferase family protein [Isosphaeraceae bacterium]